MSSMMSAMAVICWYMVESQVQTLPSRTARKSPSRAFLDTSSSTEETPSSTVAL